MLDGAVFVLTGVDEEGVQLHEFGSSDGCLEDKISALAARVVRTPATSWCASTSSSRLAPAWSAAALMRRTRRARSSYRRSANRLKKLRQTAAWG